MKIILSLFFVFFTFSLPLLSEEIPHLTLYFDINKTLIASDKKGGKSVDDVLNELLAEKYTARWDDSLNEPITFDAYVNKILVPGEREDQNLRKARKLILHHFIDYLHASSHPLYGAALQDYETALAILETSQGDVFPSFYRLLDYLDGEKISYSIILRSFGEELLDIRDEINRNHKEMFLLTGHFEKGKLLLEEGKQIDDPNAAYQLLRRIKHIAIQDDWKHWNAYGMTAKAGKPFYIDRRDRETLSIFFDDNIRKNDSVKNIILPLDIVTGEIIPIEELVQLGRVVCVDTLRAILDIDYYKNLVKEALDKREAFLECGDPSPLF